MRHLKTGKKFGRKTDPRRALMRNLVTSFIAFGKVETTLPKAKALRPKVEKFITLAKVDTIANKRLAVKYVYTAAAVKKLFTELGPKYKERHGGYTRIIKLERRLGDRAEKAILELV